MGTSGTQWTAPLSELSQLKGKETGVILHPHLFVLGRGLPLGDYSLCSQPAPLTSQGKPFEESKRMAGATPWQLARTGMINTNGRRVGHHQQLLHPVWPFQRCDQASWSSWPQLSRPRGDRLQTSDLSWVRARESGLLKRLWT